MPTVETVGPLCKLVGKDEHTMTERRARGRQRQQQERPPLQTERGNTTISDVVVSQVAGIAAQEVEGVQMGAAPPTRLVGSGTASLEAPDRPAA
jgi:hypothetical protein